MKKPKQPKKRNKIVDWLNSLDRHSFFKLIKLVFSITLLILPFLYGFTYVLGFVLGLTVMGYAFINPSPFFMLAMRKMFGIDDIDNSLVKKGVFDEYERKEKENNRYKVKYNKN